MPFRVVTLHYGGVYVKMWSGLQLLNYVMLLVLLMCDAGYLVFRPMVNFIFSDGASDSCHHIQFSDCKLAVVLPVVKYRLWRFSVYQKRNFMLI